MGTLMIADILITGSYGLIMPISPLFMMAQINGADIQTVAIAAAVYLMAQAGFSWIFSTFLQHKQAAKRAHGGLVFGSLIVTLVPVAYLYSTDISHIMLAQVLLGLGFGLIYPAWTWLAKEQVLAEHAKSVKKIHDIYLSLALALLAILAACGSLLNSMLLFGKKNKRRA
jgi:MFS family permease